MARWSGRDALQLRVRNKHFSVWPCRVRIIEFISIINCLEEHKETWTCGAALSSHHFHSVWQCENASKHTIIRQFWVQVTCDPGESFSNCGIVSWIHCCLLLRRVECIAPALNAALAHETDYFLQYPFASDISGPSPLSSDTTAISHLKLHALSVYTLLFLMCLFPLEEAARWKITAFPFGAWRWRGEKKGTSLRQRGRNIKAGVKHGFILAEGNSTSGQDFWFFGCKKKFHGISTGCDVLMQFERVSFIECWRAVNDDFWVSSCACFLNV